MLSIALKRASVNRWTNFHNIFYMQKAVWTIFQQLCFEILQGGWETGKEPKTLAKFLQNFAR